MSAELALLTFVTPCDWDCGENYLDASTIPHNNHNPQSTHLTHLRGTFVRDLGYSPTLQLTLNKLYSLWKSKQ